MGIFALMLLIVSFVHFHGSASANEQDVQRELMLYNSLKITVVSEETCYEWEYENPNHFEYEKGKRVVKGTEAKEKVVEVLEMLRFSQGPSAEQMAAYMKQNGFEGIESLKIKMLDQDRCLFTWVWNE